ncbi:MAG TPA: cupin domain-containing protein [Kiloniellales bacterium]|nr:cupin domain-containing protein [Kiloniellales bacterium]
MTRGAKSFDMTDEVKTRGGQAEPPGSGHNSAVETAEKEVVWERWTKKRTFVRALEGTYGELVQELFKQPRIYRSTDWKWKGGPQNFGKKIINPQSVKVAQSIECHIDVFAPGGYGQKHGHMNSAVFFVLKGKGHDVHDKRRIDWEAGDALIVENACVHQHLNDDHDDETIVLVMKAKPLFLFMHMMFQKVVEFPPKVPAPGQENYTPPETL